MSLMLTMTTSPPAGIITAESLLQSSTIKLSVTSTALSNIKETATHCIAPGLLLGGKMSVAGERPLKSTPSGGNE